ncbi:hypothetical protein MUP77_08905 [Candidatus Bathyarchaeota archaeon]|nr:hypothetical protein [Candidatus Bathyarchaeota archaeon]
MSIIDWRIITQATFFVALALLGVTVTVYTLSILLLGRAINIIENKFKRIELKRKEQDEQLETIKQRIATAKSAKALTEIRQEISELEAGRKENTRRLKDTARSLDAFTIGGIVYPSLCFFCSIILSILGWSLSEYGSCFLIIGILKIPIIPSTWFLALAAMAYGLYRLYLLVKGIRYVAG